MVSSAVFNHQSSLSGANVEPVTTKKMNSSPDESAGTQKSTYLLPPSPSTRYRMNQEKKQQEKEEKKRKKKIEAEKKATTKTKKTSLWSSCFGGLFRSRKTNDDECDEYEETVDGTIDELNVIVESKDPSAVICPLSPNAPTYDQSTSNQSTRQYSIVSEAQGETVGAQESSEFFSLSPSAPTSDQPISNQSMRQLFVASESSFEAAGTQEPIDFCSLSPSAPTCDQSISNQPIRQPSIVSEASGETVGIQESTAFCTPSFSATDENEMLRLQLEQKNKDLDELKSQMEQLKIYSNEQTYALENIIAAHFGALEQNNKSAHEEEIRGLNSQLTMLQSLTLEQARQISSLEMLLLESRNENKYGCSCSLPRIYFERQREALCGMHAINNMLQGSVFNRRQMFSFAYEVQKIIDQCEPTTWRRRRSDDKKMFTYEGYLNIAVLEKALLSLETGPLHLVPWYHPDQAEGRKDPANLHSALIVNVGNTHWVSWRKIRGKWFYFDSLNDEEIACPDDELLTVLNNGLRKNCSIYFVIGSLPGPL
jgi:hypothetical protein